VAEDGTRFEADIAAFALIADDDAGHSGPRLLH
jgi:hypothetical protein